MSRMFERLDLQVGQLYRSVVNIASPRHLRLGAKAAWKQTKENAFLYSGTLMWDAQAFAASINILGWSPHTAPIILGLTAAPSIALLAPTAGLGFFRGMRASKSSLDILETLTKRKWKMKDLVSVSDFLDRHPEKEYASIAKAYAGNEKLDGEPLNESFGKAFKEEKPKNIPLLETIIRNENYSYSVASKLKDAATLNDLSAGIAVLHYDSSGGEVSSYDLGILKKAEPFLEKADDFRLSLVKAYAMNCKGSLWNIDTILKADVKEEYKNLYISSLQSANSTYYLGSITSLADSLKDTPLFDYLEKPLSKGISSDSLNELRYNKSDILKNPDALKVVKDLLKKSQRRDFSASMYTVMSFINSSPNSLRELAAYGKKKRQSMISKLNPMFKLFRKDAISMIDSYRGAGITIEEILDKDIVKEKIGDYFGAMRFSESLTNNELMNILAGYQHNKDKGEFKPLFGHVIEGKDIWDYRDSIGTLKEMEESNPVLLIKWMNGYNNTKSSDGKITIDFASIARENYDEALEHLKAQGFDVEESENIYTHSSELVRKYGNRDEVLVRDAIEHLQLVQSLDGKKEIKADSLVYSTGNIKDFLFIGEKPQQTCLGLTRFNSDCLLSMMGQPNTLPFITFAKYEGTKTPIARSILRIEGKDLIVDDIYGKTCSFIEEVKSFADSLELKLLVPDSMSYRLSDSDQKFVKKNKLVGKYEKGDTKGLYYSDSLHGRVNSEAYFPEIIMK